MFYIIESLSSSRRLLTVLIPGCSCGHLRAVMYLFDQN
jgi:hypothetical protein